MLGRALVVGDSSVAEVLKQCHWRVTSVTTDRAMAEAGGGAFDLVICVADGPEGFDGVATAEALVTRHPGAAAVLLAPRITARLQDRLSAAPEMPVVRTPVTGRSLDWSIAAAGR